MIYRNTDTGVLLTEYELKILWEQFGNEMKMDSYEEFIDTLEEVEGPFYVVAVGKHDEFTEEKYDDADEAIEAAKHWYYIMTPHDRARQTIEIRKYAEDIEDDDCDCFDYETIEWH